MQTQLLLTLGSETHEEAVLRLVDWDTKETLRELSYRSAISTFLERVRRDTPDAVPPNITSKCKFNGGTAWERCFYTCTFNEVVCIRLDDWTVDHTFSKKTFNDLHHVHVDASGIYVCNNGLDVVEHFDHEWNLRRIFPLMEHAIWERFSPDVDYRFVPQITPRISHPNHIVRHGETLLVNCSHRRCVTDLNNRTVITGFPGMMHDGILRDGTYYWTCVNGRIMLVDPSEMAITDEIDLTHVYGKHEPGWCRGLEVIGNLAFIGYSRYRKPSKKEFFQFAVRGRKILSTHILCYDLRRRMPVEDWFFPKEDTVIYAIHACPLEIT